jgi:protein-disulfide isomerase
MIRTLKGAAMAVSVLAAGTAGAQEALTPAQREAVNDQVRAYLLENPEIILEALDILEQRRGAARAEEDGALVAAQQAALFQDGYSHVFGDPDGDVTIVEFADYRCGYCKAAHPQVAELLESDGDIRLILKELPILGPDSVLAARVAMAALNIDPDGYERLHDAMMEHRGALSEEAVFGYAREAGLDEAALRDAMEDPAIAENIRRTYELAQALRIEGTPSFVIGDQIVRGFVQLDQMRALVQAARDAAG